MTRTCQSGGKVLVRCIHIVAGSSRSGICRLSLQYQGTRMASVGPSVSSGANWVLVAQCVPEWAAAQVPSPLSAG
eukprot:12911457-Prorocentrum_lima.AAC.1